MHPRVYKEYVKVLETLEIKGSILEVGAIPDKKTLLSASVFKNVDEKVGLNLSGPYEFEDFKILKGNSNSMKVFEDEKFDLVLCNAVAEHDKYFWKSISEIKRVLKKGGIVIYGAPGFKRYKFEKLKSVLNLIPYMGKFVYKLEMTKYFNFLLASTITHVVHYGPGDYYRFSPQCFEEVFLEGFSNTKVWEIMFPPRIIGMGIKN